ncbi:MAG: sulfatase-like hydrolase/transferase [Verrucomicrobia bacterium]|nr:sulfatase-like hydrolase/transferase [Verrucomicrobiota bacterium]
MKLRIAVAAVLCALSSPAAAPQARPNFLFLYTDDQRYDALSVVQAEQGPRGRFPWFKTPNLDRLAADGVRFRQAFVVNSLCSPSRAVYLTGRYNHENGIASNFRPFPVTNTTHATVLRAAGYTTGYIGKWHMDSQRERPGFDFVASFIAHARYVDPVLILDGKDTPSQGWIDDLSTDHALRFLRQQKGAAKPWSLVVGFKSPHGPFEPPARAKDRFAGERARVVPNLTTPAPYMGARAATTSAPPATTVPVSLDYFRCISAVDDCVGRLLEALDQLGLAQNTVVVFASDNGFYLGEHGLGDKRSAYDESLRIPFLVRAPMLGAAARGRVVDEMVLNLDLAPTLLDFADVPVPKEMQGRSLRPLLTGEPNARAAWRQSWFYEYFAENQRNSRVPDITAVRTTDAKLIKYPGFDQWAGLFDLTADPYETRNLIADPAHASLRERLEREHARLLAETGYRVPAYTDRPPWWGKPGGPDWQPEPAQPLRLAFDAARLEGARLVDSSGLGNDGQVHGVTRVAGRDGKPALRFDGEAFVEVAKSKSLNPANSLWTVEAVMKSEKPDGIIVARGGKTHGYALWLQAGRPAFSVTIANQLVTAQAEAPVTGWTTLAGLITADRHAELRVDGKIAARLPLPDFITRDPNDSMQVGADHGSPVLTPSPPAFTGLLESLRLIAGGPKP